MCMHIIFTLLYGWPVKLIEIKYFQMSLSQSSLTKLY